MAIATIVRVFSPEVGCTPLTVPLITIRLVRVTISLRGQCLVQLPYVVIGLTFSRSTALYGGVRCASSHPMDMLTLLADVQSV